MRYSADVKNAYRACDKLARQRARNFYPAFRFLPEERRLALSAFYSYCSLSDDTVDSPNEVNPEDKRLRLDVWRGNLNRMYAGNPTESTFIALADAIQRFNLPKQPFYDLLDGVEMDLTIDRYENFDDLLVYCRRVASSVGIVSAKIFGCTHPGGEVYADNLGIAFQLTNIMRDVHEDFKMNRIYLPREEMERFNYSETDLKQALNNENFKALMTFQYKRVLTYYKLAKPSLAESQAKKLFTAELMKSVYWRLLHEIKNRHFDIFNSRIKVPRHKMIAGITSVALKHLFS